VTPEQAAHDTRDALVRGTAKFMSDPKTYEQGTTHGFDGLDFYIGGRGGVLGDVASDIVTAAFVFFPEDTIRPRWDRAGLVMTRRRAAMEFAACAHTWAEEHIPDDIDAARLAELAGRVETESAAALAPLFAGWRLLDEPRAPKSLAIHRLNALRELRGAIHAAAILTVGLSPIEAIAVSAPTMLRRYSWPEPWPEPGPLRERWNLAEARTDRVFGRRLAVLDETERKELVELLHALPST
jgi:hypothetical protein